MLGPLQLTIDAQTFEVNFQGWHKPLEVSSPAGQLAPWSIGAHSRALSLCQRGDALDVAAFCREVLGQCWSGAEAGPEALALWWATGAEPALIGVSDGVMTGKMDETLDGALSFGSVTARFAPWSFAGRLKALEEAGAFAESPQLDAGRWCLARVEACLTHVEPDGYPVQALPAAPVLSTLERVNQPEDGVELSRLPAPVRATLRRVCRALGWTPAQALAAPAHEIDRLLILLDDAPEPSRPVPQGIAAMPDAMVIHFGTSPEES